MSRAKFFETRTRQCDFVFFPSVTSLCVSSLQILLCRYQLVRIIRFSQKNYDGLTIYLVPNFRPPNFLLRVLSKNFSNFEFLVGKIYKFESCLYKKLRTAHIFALFGRTPLGWAMCFDSVSQKTFCGQFLLKEELKILIFSSNQIRHSALPTAFLNFQAHFLQAYLQSQFAYCLAALAVSQLIGSEKFGGKNFSAGDFLAETIEIADFFRRQTML